MKACFLEEVDAGFDHCLGGYRLYIPVAIQGLLAVGWAYSPVSTILLVQFRRVNVFSAC